MEMSGGLFNHRTAQYAKQPRRRGGRILQEGKVTIVMFAFLVRTVRLLFSVYFWSVVFVIQYGIGVSHVIP